jgi:hypothetical protein
MASERRMEEPMEDDEGTKPVDLSETEDDSRILHRRSRHWKETWVYSVQLRRSGTVWKKEVPLTHSLHGHGGCAGHASDLLSD